VTCPSYPLDAGVFASPHFSGKERCHQNFNVMEYPPHASNKLLPRIDAVGVLGIKCTIGVLN
jgi:hypothetical protein